MNLERFCMACSFAAGLLIYLNTLPASFAFDDNFAVIYNGDVTNDGNTLLGMLGNDFWGQNIRSDMSHKSYRPATVLSFRLTRILWHKLPPAWTQAVRNWRSSVSSPPPSSDQEQGPSSMFKDTDEAEKRGLDPLLFHAANIIWHAITCALVSKLVYYLFYKRLSLMPSQGSKWTQVHLPSWLASLAFALHPVHTEAVAGVVGHAELLSASLSIIALLCFLNAVESPPNQSEEADEKVVGRTNHWLLVLASVVFCWAAALSKEIGITTFAAMLAYDILLVPLDLDVGAKDRGLVRTLLFQTKWARGMILTASTLTYIKTRGFIAGDQLVRIYRKVENPIAFAPEGLPRLLSTFHLHARYALLFIWPQHLSADWSFACIPLVEDLRDPRNLLSLLLYLSILALLVTARPWRILTMWYQQALTSSHQPVIDLKGDRVRQWRLMVLAGLVIGPFLPAANLFFYVGTFIGERLMYFPSIGFCILMGEILASCMGTQDSSKTSKGLIVRGILSSTARVSLSLLCIVILCLYGERTYRRNWDWLNDEALFISANEVCSQSAKVQLNTGILQRRKMDMDKALKHFQAASAIEPGYCEPGYWEGITLINLGQLAPGLQKLEEALGCKYVAANALKTLNTMIQILVNTEPANPKPHTMWGNILLRSEVWQPHVGCGALETAAALNAKKLDGPQASMACDSCISRLQEALKKYQGGGEVKLGGLVETERKEASQEALSLHRLLSCVTARKQVYISLGNYGPKSKKARQALYTYVSFVRNEAPWCRSSSDESPRDSQGQPPPQQAPTSHLQVVHTIQSIDAEDPHLQVEWGETILLQGRLQEAALHVNAGGMLFSMIADAAAKAEAAARIKKKGTSSKGVITRAPDNAKSDEAMRMSLDGRLLDQRLALGLAAEAYERAADLVMPLQVPTDSTISKAVDLTEGGCEMRIKALEARVVLLELISSDEREEEDGSHKEEAITRTTIKDGLRRLGALTSCTAGNNGLALNSIKRRWDILQ